MQQFNIFIEQQKCEWARVQKIENNNSPNLDIDALAQSYATYISSKSKTSKTPKSKTEVILCNHFNTLNCHPIFGSYVLSYLVKKLENAQDLDEIMVDNFFLLTKKIVTAPKVPEKCSFYTENFLKLTIRLFITQSLLKNNQDTHTYHHFSSILVDKPILKRLMKELCDNQYKEFGTKTSIMAREIKKLIQLKLMRHFLAKMLTRSRLVTLGSGIAKCIADYWKPDAKFINSLGEQSPSPSVTSKKTSKKIRLTPS